MPKYAAKADINQPEIIDALKDAGATVRSLHAVGMGCPDLLVGFRGANLLIEVKSPLAKKKDGGLTPPQIYFRDHWNGSMSIVRTIDDALAAIGVKMPSG